MIQAYNLVKIFNDRKRGQILAVNQVSFQSSPGKIYGLLGANGAGKTTLLRILATLLKPSSGDAQINKYSVLFEPEKVRKSIGFLSTSTALYGRLTARELVEYFGRLYGLPDSIIQRRIKDIFTFLEMNEFAEGRCDKLSTGQKQRVSIARSIIHEPPVMIFDEPTTGLDVMTSRTIMRFIERCRSEGRTVIFSTHIMSEVERLCDCIAIIHNGYKITEGSLEELRDCAGLQSLESIFLKLVGESNG